MTAEIRMNETFVRAWLRGATKAGILTGWYVIGEPFARQYIIAPLNGDTQTLTHDQAVAYIMLLWEFDEVEPIYRDSEPDFEAAA